MIQTFLTTLVIISTNVVVAQAAVSGIDVGIARVETAAWTATHTGTTELDGVPVLAVLEEKTSELSVPEFYAGNIQTLVPIVDVKTTSYRITLASIEQPNLKARFRLVPGKVSVDGMIRHAFVSQNPHNSDFVFTVIPLENGGLKASYSRKISDTEVTQGEIFLDPAMTLMQK